LELLNLIISANPTEAIFLTLVLLSSSSFLRISIIFGFVKIGLGLNGLAGTLWSFLLSLSLCLLISNPLFTDLDTNLVNSSGVQEQNTIILKTLQNSLTKKLSPEDLAVVDSYGSKTANVQGEEVKPLGKLFPAYILSEIKWSFKTGLKILLPFLVIDLIVAHVFTALGVVTLSTFSLSFSLKVLLLASIGGWDLIVKNILSTQ
jgi:flagellar biosynthesis protein FliP